MLCKFLSTVNQLVGILYNQKFWEIKLSESEFNYLNYRHPLLTHGFSTLAGNAYGSYETPKLTFGGRVNLKAGVNKLALLSSTVGLPVSDESTLFQNILIGTLLIVIYIYIYIYIWLISEYWPAF